MALFQKAQFFTTVAQLRDVPDDATGEVAFAGRSNAGKSSAINTLANQTRLAFVSKTPGRTQNLNYFTLAEGKYLVDLPGYGYAKVSRTEKERWGRLMERYFQDEGGILTMGVLIVDARHKPTQDDVTMHTWFRESGCPEVVVANKLDKLKAREVEPNLALIRDTLEMGDNETMIPFSAEKGVGKEQLIALLTAACRE